MVIGWPIPFPWTNTNYREWLADRFFHGFFHGSEPTHYPWKVLKFLVNLGRGVLIGAVEVVPGVSGGTLALIVGIYQTLINSIADLVLSARQLVGLAPGKASAKVAVTTFKSLPWRLLIPVAVGMVAAVILGAKLIEPLLVEQPIAMKALFFGLVIAGTYVPAHMVAKVGGSVPFIYHPRFDLSCARIFPYPVCHKAKRQTQV